MKSSAVKQKYAFRVLQHFGAVGLGLTELTMLTELTV